MIDCTRPRRRRSFLAPILLISRGYAPPARERPDTLVLAHVYRTIGHPVCSLRRTSFAWEGGLYAPLAEAVFSSPLVAAHLFHGPLYPPLSLFFFFLKYRPPPHSPFFPPRPLFG